MTSKLRIVEPHEPTIADKIAQAQLEARALGHVDAVQLRDEISELRLHAEAVARGGDAYPGGVREIARIIVQQLQSHELNLLSLINKKAADQK